MVKRASLAEILFGFFFLLAAAFPFMRFWAGPVPIYLLDIIIILSFIAILLKKKNVLKLPGTESVLFLIILLLASTFVVSLLTGEFLNVAYRNGRRILAITTFFISGWICLNIPDGGKRIERIIRQGLFLHILAILVQVFLYLSASELLAQLDDFYYRTLSSISRTSRIQLWVTTWYIPRAYGGYWNPNVAVAALLIPFPFVLSLQNRFSGIGLSLLGLVAMLLTGSRQGIVTLLVISIMFIVISRGLHVRYKLGLLLTGMVLITIAAAFFQSISPRTSQRLLESYDYDTFLISVQGRLNNYPDFFDYMFYRNPEYLPFGQGVDFYNIKLHSNINVEYGGGFASNSWLLLISQQGIVAYLVFTGFFLTLFSRTKSLVFRLCLISFAVLGLFDNHIAIYESLQVMFWTIAGLASASSCEEIQV